ncbi:MAG: hypothetical protein COB29_01120 [Sulfitobacter sp.]|nr:MAG: hypothetical protein COB29_01120 [Sulfitobacter sp.]
MAGTAVTEALLVFDMLSQKDQKEKRGLQAIGCSEQEKIMRCTDTRVSEFEEWDRQRCSQTSKKWGKVGKSDMNR